MYKAIELALSQVGYLEKASDKDLDSFTANAGSANYTKYARDIDAINQFYNGKKQGYSWCETFADWNFVQAYGADMAMKMLYQPERSLGASCTYSVGYYKAAGRFYLGNPKVGDQIYLKVGGSVGHTGLVYKVTGTTVYTVEGNTSGASGVVANGGGVFKKSYSINDSRIYGYGRPDYALAGDTGEEKEDTGGKIMVGMTKLKRGDKGVEVKTLQALLIKKFGISCGLAGMDGDFGSGTEKAVKKFQSKKSLAQDGIVGEATWNALLK